MELTAMKWIEIVRLRTTESEAYRVTGVLKTAQTDLNGMEGLIGTDLYINAAVGTDVSLHLLWDTREISFQGSETSMALVQGLRRYGIVDHSVWLRQ